MKSDFENSTSVTNNHEARKMPRRAAKVLGATVAAAVVGTSFYGAFAADKHDKTPAVETHKEYTVEPGDTLWRIAKSAAPDADPRTEVDLLREQLPDHSVVLTPGQTLRLPEGSEIGTTAPGPFENSGQ